MDDREQVLDSAGGLNGGRERPGAYSIQHRHGRVGSVDQRATLKVIFRDGEGPLGERLLYRDDEPSLELVEIGRPWSFDGDGDLLRLVSEA